MKVLAVVNDKNQESFVKSVAEKQREIRECCCISYPGELVSYLKQLSVDIVLIDLDILKDSSRKLLHDSMQYISSSRIILLSKFRDFAVEAYDLEIGDFILKPTTQERLEKALRRLIGEKSKENQYFGKKLSVYLLGSSYVICRDNGKIRFNTSKSQELFMYLLLKGARGVEKNKVIEDIFYNPLEEKGEQYLNTTVYRLRKALREQGVEDLIEYQNQEYRMRSEEVYVDIIEFEQGIKKYFSGQLTFEEALRIEALYQGRLFGEKGFYWALNEMESLDVKYIKLATDLVEKLCCRGRFPETLSILKKSLVVDPFYEETYYWLLKIYKSEGMKDQLKQLYKKYEKLMKEELNEGPSERIKSLVT